jgi:hypothetical protein
MQSDTAAMRRTRQTPGSGGHCLLINIYHHFPLPPTFLNNTSVQINKNHTKTKQKKQTPWPESASELYRPSDRRLSAK